MPRSSSRRCFLQAAGALALVGAVIPGAASAARLRLPASAFTLGVASGYPQPDGVVLWTRLAPKPLEPGGGMPQAIVPVRWEVAEDEGFRRIVHKGQAYAVPEWAHAVHVEVDGLLPSRWYWYRFIAAGEVSPVGRTRTAPAAGETLERMRFAFASCQQYEQGYYAAYRHLQRDELDLIVHLGDYIYESSWGKELVRRHNAPEPHTLEDYRIRYALYRSDPDLQAAHAHCPWLVTWDDHEVDNDYAADRSEDDDERAWFLLRRAAAYRAYFEHMPLRRTMLPLGPHMRLHSHLAWGGLASFYLLDDRQYRAYQPCPRPGRGGANMVEECAERLDPSRSLLGLAQERWLEARLSASQAKWNVIAQQTLMAQIDVKPGEGQRFWTDGWDGYPASRQRLLDHLAQHKVANPVCIGGDLHSFWVTDLKRDANDPQSATVATEFVGTSISSQGRSQSEIDKRLPDNPHVRYANSQHRGYTRAEISRRGFTADLRALKDVRDRESPCSTLASFVVEHGKPGAQRA